MRTPPKAAVLLGCLALAAGTLRAEVLKVPADHPTIKSAVSHAADGDVVLVDDGIYLEKNIVVARKIQVKAKNRFGAIVYGSRRTGDAIFVVQAAARIEGFVLRNSDTGIEQRGSPDVQWEAADLAILECMVGLSVNDADSNVGSAVVRRVVVFGYPASTGISTNDAGRIEASGCLITDCGTAFQGYDHLSFEVEDALIIGCALAFDENTGHRPVPPATSRIVRGEGVRVLDALDLKDARQRGEAEAFIRKSVLEDGALETGGGLGLSEGALLAYLRARILSGGGTRETAAMGFAKARAAAERAGLKEWIWQAIMGAARAAEAWGAKDEAIAKYDEAVDFLEGWLPDLAVGIYRIDFLDEKMEVFEALIRLLLERHRLAPREGWDEKAFEYAERSKGLDRLFRVEAGGGAAHPARDLTEAGRSIAALQIALQDPDLASGDKERLVALLESAEEEYHAALIGREMAGGGAAAGPSPIGYREVRERLGDRVVLSYVVGARASYAFLATGDGLEAARLPGGREIGTAVERYLRFLQITDGGGFRGWRAGRLLFDILVGPFAEELGESGRRVIIVPDGLLHYLPFEALVHSDGDGREKWEFWGQTVEIGYAASATQALAGAASDGAGIRSAKVLAVGSPEGIACDNRAKREKRLFSPLKHVEEEIRRLRRSFPEGNVTAVLGEDASETWFKAAGLGRYGIIHVAAHGVIDDVNWWRSALLMKPAPKDGEDGFLTALEIAELDLAARLVVLSGCGTGAGRLFGGAGIKGLSGAFLQAGAELVLVSLWSVDDRATAVFMGEFYRRLSEGDPPVRALALAKTWMIGAGYRDPVYWAPFVMIGKAAD